jgi:protein with PEP-CTERM/exosortase system signal
MNKGLVAICGVVVLVGGSRAQAATITLNTADAGFLGVVDPGSPAELQHEAFYLNFLLDQPTSTSITISDTPGPPTNDEHTFIRSSNPCIQPSPCPDATLVNAVKADPPGDTSSLNLTAWTYLLAKYGNDSYVWFVGNINAPDVAALPTTGPNGNGLSHYSLFNQTGVSVPDGGTTMMLLGGALLALALLRRRGRPSWDRASSHL